MNTATQREPTLRTPYDRGAFITFHEPVSGIGRLRHPNLTVTVLDVDGLIAAIDR